MIKEVRINVRIPLALKRQVKAKAALQGKTLSDVVRELLEDWVGEDFKQQ